MSNLSSGADEVTVEATTAGVFQIEAYGYTATEYRLNITKSAATATAEAELAGGLDPNKPQLAAPLVPHASEPGTQVAIPAVGIEQQPIYLPLVRR